MNANTKPFTLAQVDELDTLKSCLSVVSDLMVPQTDLSMVNRDDLSLLLRHLTEKLRNLANPKTFSLDCFDELHELQCYFSAIADLMVPQDSLCSVSRDDLAGLLMYLTDRLHKSLEGAG